jgi:sodium-dependent dicarboxylate transporter 2/3/5
VRPAGPASGIDFEARFERRMKTLGLLAGPIAAALLYALNPGGHPPEARCLLAVVALTVCFWVTEAIPLPATALLASSLCIILGVAPARAVLAPYADPVIFLFIGSFLLAEAFRKYGLDRRLAGRLLGRGPFARSALGRILGVGGSSAVISTCLSNTATAAVMTPIAIGAVQESAGASPAAAAPEERPADLPEARPADAPGRTPAWVSGVVLMVAYGASIGGMATLIGTPPNLLVAGFIERMCGVRVGFVPWLAFGVPIALILLAASVVWTHLVLGRHGEGRHGDGRPESGRAGDPAGGGAARAPAGPQEAGGEARARGRGARLTLLAFGLAATLWTLPSLASLAFGRTSPLALTLDAHLPEAGVALLCATLLFLAPVDWRRRRFALSWEEGRQVNWGIILLFGGGLSLGTLSEATGVARWVGEGLLQFGLARSAAGLLFCAVALTILVSEFASNTAATSLLVPVVIAAAQAAGLDPVRPALGVGLAATCGFIFPVSTPPNAIVFGTGLVPLRRMIRAGILLDLTALFVVWGGLLLLTPLLPR